MIPVKVISQVEIPAISEDVIAELIKKEILRSNPELTVKEVTFERKLNPQRIVALVDAQLTGPATTTQSDEVVKVADESTEEVVEAAVEEEEVTTVSDLFNED